MFIINVKIMMNKCQIHRIAEIYREKDGKQGRLCKS